MRPLEALQALVNEYEGKALRHGFSLDHDTYIAACAMLSRVGMRASLRRATTDQKEKPE